MAFKDARKGRGLYTAEVIRRHQLSPHVVRLTLAGDDLRQLPRHGYDQWFRIFLPGTDGPADLSRMPDQFGMTGYLKYLRTPAGNRPVFRNYTVRELRIEAGELDIDFVVHGDEGIAGRWAVAAEPGEQVALIDQGTGFDLLPDADFHLLVGDESAMPAILGILRDLPAEARGLALIEVPDAADTQPVERPEGVTVQWLPRDNPHATPGELALAGLREFTPANPHLLSAYVVGEQALATEGRRHLVAAGVPKHRIMFVGYWRVGRAS
ncbi:MAG: siderophore-interacting protein [Propionicimonas sp.]|uniref:siderophore-interacting protein n=1 Tax=Propionicimonas sp. TaxID=1955623 RepID=UPI002B21555A|nr:siderophore-interacting protein [Propionicimonas sp.]MEA4945194.1 siderophore-interacting protein [Propionicimonas sp.]